MKQVFDDRDRFVQWGIVHGMIGQCGNSVYPTLYARIEEPDIFRFIMEQLGDLHKTP